VGTRSRAADYLIIGAGCSGLSLAVHLIESGACARGKRIVIVDPRTSFERDRTWCSFHVMRHPFERAISQRWSRWTVRARGRSIERSSRAHSYEHVPADAFYALALEKIRAAGDAIELRLGERVDVLEERDREGHVVARTDRGELGAKLAFDSRPSLAATTEPGEVRLLQHFVGHVVRAPTDAFDPDVATLMDFDVTQERGIHFMYVLPFDAKTALVEATWFTRAVHADDATYTGAIEAYLRERHHVGVCEVVHRERGVLPMTTERLLVRAPGARRVYRIGLAGGLAKPSTGYAFLAIQRFSRALAAKLGRAREDEAPEPPLVRPRRSERLDRIFVGYLDRHPEGAPGVLFDLFDRVPADVVARFLSDAGTVADDLRVMKAMPALPLVAEAARRPTRWLRR